MNNTAKFHKALKHLSCILPYNVFIGFIHIFDHLFDYLIVYFCLFALVLFQIMLISHNVHLYSIIYGGNIIWDV